jgi:hypothetical protein
MIGQIVVGVVIAGIILGALKYVEAYVLHVIIQRRAQKQLEEMKNILAAATLPQVDRGGDEKRPLDLGEQDRPAEQA